MASGRCLEFLIEFKNNHHKNPLSSTRSSQLPCIPPQCPQDTKQHPTHSVTGLFPSFVHSDLHGFEPIHSFHQWINPKTAFVLILTTVHVFPHSKAIYQTLPWDDILVHCFSNCDLWTRIKMQMGSDILHFSDVLEHGPQLEQHGEQKSKTVRLWSQRELKRLVFIPKVENWSNSVHI